MKKDQVDALMAQVHLHKATRRISDRRLVEQGVDFLWHLRSQASSISTETRKADHPEAQSVHSLVQRAFHSPLTGSALVAFTDKSLEEMIRLLTIVCGGATLIEAEFQKLILFLRAMGGTFSPLPPPVQEVKPEVQPPEMLPTSVVSSPEGSSDPETVSPATTSAKGRHPRRVRGVSVAEESAGKDLPIDLKEKVEDDLPKED